MCERQFQGGKANKVARLTWTCNANQVNLIVKQFSVNSYTRANLHMSSYDVTFKTDETFL